MLKGVQYNNNPNKHQQLLAAEEDHPDKAFANGRETNLENMKFKNFKANRINGKTRCRRTFSRSFNKNAKRCSQSR